MLHGHMVFYWIYTKRVGTCTLMLYSQETGIPQGSILSVTLFSLKINSSVYCLMLNAPFM